MWNYNRVVEEFETLLAKAERECSDARHQDVECHIYDIAHVSVGYLCKRCHYKFIRDWDVLLRPHANTLEQREIDDFLEKIQPKLKELGLE